VEQFSFQAVQETSIELNNRGLKTQVNPREINLFYLSPNKRERIIKNDDHTFSVGSISFSKGDLLNRLKENPQDFSPNVILRPVYQEFLLPNICYVGGVGELNYWLQLKGVFDRAKVVFPLIQVRSSMFYFDSALLDKIDGLGLLWKDFFKEKDEHKMYEQLFEATMAMHESRDMFNNFDEKDIYILCDHRTPFVIIELKDYEQ
jgi:uncharacterized protein YllA (UPF0747 family)